MAEETKINPSTGNLDLVGGGVTTGGGVNIPQYSSDPTSPLAEDAWVLRSGAGGSGGGAPIGLLLSLTKTSTGTTFTYQFSYRTEEGTTKRVTIS